jgi:hypothetical protein
MGNRRLTGSQARGSRLTLALFGVVAWTALAGAGSALADGSGTFECIQAATESAPATVVLDVSMQAGTSGSTGMSYGDPGDSTLTYCTLAGTVPTGWTVALYGGTDLYLADGSANDGTIEIGSEHDNFNEATYSGSVLGYGTFTNNGQFVTNDDEADGATGGYGVGVEVPDFINDGTFDVATPSVDSASVDLGYQYSVPGANDGLPPTTDMTFENNGTFEAAGSTSVTVGTTTGSGYSFTFDNAGTLSVAADSSVSVGQSNDYYCGGQNNTIAFTLAAGSTVENDGSFTDFCNTYEVAGGEVTGSSPPLIAGSDLIYDTGIKAVKGTTNTIDIQEGTLTGVIPAGWTLAFADGGSSEVTAQPGAGNDGTLDLTYRYRQLTDSADFTNLGTLELDGSTINTPDLINEGKLIMYDGSYANQGFLGFGVPSNYTQTNRGTLQVVLTSGYSTSLQVNGTATLAGRLVITTDKSAPPTPAENPWIIQANSVTGTFATVIGARYGNLAYAPDYASNHVQITITATGPVNTSAPSISGTAAEGDTLTAAPGTWASPSAPSYVYHWERCYLSGRLTGKCLLIGATGSTYTLRAADVGQQVEVAVVASDAAGKKATAISAAYPSGGAIAG